MKSPLFFIFRTINDNDIIEIIDQSRMLGGSHVIANIEEVLKIISQSIPHYREMILLIRDHQGMYIQLFLEEDNYYGLQPFYTSNVMEAIAYLSGSENPVNQYGEILQIIAHEIKKQLANHGTKTNISHDFILIIESRKSGSSKVSSSMLSTQETLTALETLNDMVETLKFKINAGRGTEEVKH